MIKELSDMVDDISAVISDIHGNRWALEIILEDIYRRNIKQIFNLGDCLYGPLDPAGTADILIDLNIPAVRGNEDRILSEPAGDEINSSPSLSFVLKCLNGKHLDWLKSFETIKSFDDEILMFHGSPEDDTKYFLHDVMESGAAILTDAALRKNIRNLPQKIILCGHDHIPNTFYLDEKLVVNPGSVGLQAYTDDLPFPHYMESGTPHARYAVVRRDDPGWSVENIKVSYDWNTASDIAKRNGRPDWAYWLMTGRAK